MPTLEPVSGTFALPLWMAGALAALFIVVCVIALNRDSANSAMRLVVRASVVFVGALMVLALFRGSGSLDRSADRRQAEARLLDLTMRVPAGSSLACLTGVAGETVEASCERALFAAPETVAAAISFVEAQLALLANSAEFEAPGVNGDGSGLTGLRRALESDRYGFVAQVFAVRRGCNAEQCPAFASLRDASRVKANLKTQRYDNSVRRYAVAWPNSSTPVVALVAPPAGAGTAVLASSGGTGTGASLSPPSDVDLPSAASIPPISIMNSEPSTAAAQAARTETADAGAGGRKQRRAGAAAAQTTASAPAAPPNAVRFAPLPITPAPESQQVQ